MSGGLVGSLISMQVLSTARAILTRPPERAETNHREKPPGQD